MEENNRNQGGQNNQSGQQQRSGLSWSQPAPVSSGSVRHDGGSQNANANNKPPVQQQQKPVQPIQKGSSKKTIGIVIAVVVLVALAVWVFKGTREDSVPASDSTATSTSDTAATQETTTPSTSIKPVATPVTTTTTSSLVIVSPQDAGLQVAVSNITVSVLTWVVIYENHNGQPGNALGASLFSADKTSGVVDLLRGTLPGQTYIAGEAQDDGDHIFSLQNDPAVRDAQGNPVWVSFKTR
ncbi:MAG: hypothetical protein Q7S26_00205 [bacterium]|nr:hypothetical protein [bacterium]